MERLYSLPVVLIVSRDVRKINFIKRVLKEEFYVLEAKEGEAALEWMGHTAIDLLIIDEKEIDFLTLCQHVRKRSEYKTIPILLISNNLKRTFTKRALAAGINDFLREPLDDEEVLQRLAVVEKIHQTEKKLTEFPSRLQKAMPKGNKTIFQRLILGGPFLNALRKIDKAKRPLSFLLIQIDRFSEIIDRWGGTTEKELSHQMKEFLTKIKRPGDLLLPQINDQYLLVLPLSSISDAEEMALKIKTKLKDTIFATKKKDLVLTASIQCGSFSATGEVDRLSELSKRIQK
jgi:two-component system, cell cycle response regulator